MIHGAGAAWVARQTEAAAVGAGCWSGGTDKTKQRIGRYIEDAVLGSSNAEVRGLATKAVELAHHVKHSETSSRRDAGIAADTAILLANICRRVEQEL